MKTSSSKKKTPQKDVEFIKDENIIDSPKNLLPDYAEDVAKPDETEEKLKKEVIEESKEEVKEEVIKKSVDPEDEKKEVKQVVEAVVQEVKPPVSEPLKNEVKPEDKKPDLPFIDNKPIEIKNDDVIPASGVAAPPPIPPVSIPVSGTGMSSKSEDSKGKKFLALLLLMVIVLVVGGTWFYFSNKSKRQTEQDKLVIFKPTGIIETPASAPTKTASPEVKLDEYPIRVLNGSGISGEASKVRGLLEDGRFEVSSTGNADEFDYTDTIIQAKKEVEKSFLDRLKALLKETYSVGRDEALPASESSDVVVIVGSKKSK